MLNNCGVYKIENALNGKCYIGQSIHLKKRKNSHSSRLGSMTEDNIYLQRAYNKYGKDNFKFTVLVYCEPYELTRYEGLLDCYYKSLGISYNTRICIDSNKGLRHSDESKRKIGIANSGKKASEETRRKLSVAHYGIRLPEETCRKMSASRKGRIFSKDTREKISKSKIGKKRSEETIKKMSEVTKRRWDGLDELKKMEIRISLMGENNPRFGTHHSEETKKKMSEARKSYYRKMKDAQEIL